jgi:hypothetical protein
MNWVVGQVDSSVRRDEVAGCSCEGIGGGMFVVG